MIDFNIQQKMPPKSRYDIVKAWLSKYWFQIIVLVFLFQIYANREIQLVVAANGQPIGAVVSQTTVNTIKDLPLEHQEFSLLPTFSKSPNAVPEKIWKSSDFNNLTFILDPGLAKRKRVGDEIVLEKLNNCRNYVKRFAKTAIREMEGYGIPASITIAQGLLESNAGSSRLAKESNNHFGIKCRSKCRGCTCRNYSDDDLYDMFRVFDSSWDSFREHSLLLQISRYAHLKKLGTKDYLNWAIGLKKAGYATDKNYHKKLIRIIEELDLHQFDK